MSYTKKLLLTCLSLAMANSAVATNQADGLKDSETAKSKFSNAHKFRPTISRGDELFDEAIQMFFDEVRGVQTKIVYVPALTGSRPPVRGYYPRLPNDNEFTVVDMQATDTYQITKSSSKAEEYKQANVDSKRWRPGELESFCN